MKKILPSSQLVVWEYKAQLGEGPVWDDKSNLLYWLDIDKQQLLILNTIDDKITSNELSVKVTAIAKRTRGGLIAATENGFAELNPKTGKLNFISDPEADIPTNRFNDGKCDHAGNFIAGTMDRMEKQALGTMYRLRPNFSVDALFGQYTICNGPAFSPDGQTLYFSNSAEREILKFDYSPEEGVTGAPTIFTRISEDAGYPDGITVDASGYLWCAHWDGWRLTRFAPNGMIDQIIELPVPRVTSCTFGGPHLKTMFVTTARTGLSDEILTMAPLSGSLFAFQPEVSGCPETSFGG